MSIMGYYGTNQYDGIPADDYESFGSFCYCQSKGQYPCIVIPIYHGERSLQFAAC